MKVTALALVATVGILATTTAVTVPAVAAGTNVCTGVANCRWVASADIDGDRRTDQIGLVANKINRDGTLAVRVRTANHRLLTYTNSGLEWYGGKLFAGAAPIDGQRGSEIVVGAFMGAHYEQFHVLTYRNGHLAISPSPAAIRGWAPMASKPTTALWGLDSSASSNIGVFRSVSRSGVVTVTTKSAWRNSTSYTGKTDVYVWRAGRWVNTSSRNTAYSTDKAAFAVGGWHITGIKNYI